MPFALALVLLSTSDAVKEIREAMPLGPESHYVLRSVGPGKESFRFETAVRGEVSLTKADLPEGKPFLYISTDAREVRTINFVTGKTFLDTVQPTGEKILEEAPDAGEIEFRLSATGPSFVVGEGVLFVKDSVRRRTKTYEFRRVATDEKLTVEFPVATRNPMTIRDHGKNPSRQTIQRRDLRPTDALTIPEDLWRAYHRG